MRQGGYETHAPGRGLTEDGEQIRGAAGSVQHPHHRSYLVESALCDRLGTGVALAERRCSVGVREGSAACSVFPQELVHRLDRELLQRARTSTSDLGGDVLRSSAEHDRRC
jgi:hypothetical protein